MEKSSQHGTLKQTKILYILVAPKTPPFLIFSLFFNNLLSPTYLSPLMSYQIKSQLANQSTWFPINFRPYYFIQRTWSHWYCGCPYHVRYSSFMNFSVGNLKFRQQIWIMWPTWKMKLWDSHVKSDLQGRFIWFIHLALRPT